MTVATQTTKVTANGNDSATVFSFSPLVIFASTDIVVTHVTAAGVETLLSEGTGASAYSVQVSPYPGVGNVTYPEDEVTPLPTGESLVMKRVLTIEQLTNLENQGGYFPETQETQYDKFAMIDLQQQEELGRSIKIPVSTTGVSVELPEPVADQFLKWNSAGTSITAAATTAGVAIASGVTPEDVDFTAGAVGTGTDYAREDHAHLLPKVTVAKGGTNGVTVAEAQASLNIAGTDLANTFSKSQTWKKGADVASDTALLVNIDGNYFDVTGTTTITSLATKGIGTTIKLHFDAALTLTHNATDLVLPGGANITIAAGDEFEFTEYALGDWRCTGYALASGISPSKHPYAWEEIASGSVSAAASLDLFFTPASWRTVQLIITDFRPVTDVASGFIRTSTNGSTFDAGASDYSFSLQGGVPGSDNDHITSHASQGNATNEILALDITIYSPASAEYKMLVAIGSFMDNSGVLTPVYTRGVRKAAADVDGIQILYSSGNIASGSYKLLGLRE